MVGGEGYDSLCPFFFSLGDNMKFRVDDGESIFGEFVLETGYINALILNYGKDVLERENPDYSPYSYIEDGDEPVFFDEQTLEEWDWE